MVGIELEKCRKISEMNNEHLPPAAIHLWQHGFVTTFACYLGTTFDPWENSSEDVLEMMRKLWGYIYGSTVPYRIKGVMDVVFIVVRSF